MDEKKKGLIVLAVIAVFILLFVIIGLVGKLLEEEPSKSHVEEQKGQYSLIYEDAFLGENKKVLYIGSSNCTVCSEFTPYMQYLSEKYDFYYYYIDAAKMDTNKLKEVLDRVGQDIDDFGTPYVVFLENGKKYFEIPGYETEEELFKTLQTNEIIDSEQKYVSSSNHSDNNSDGSGSSSGTSDDNSAYTDLSFINYSQYQEIYNSGKKAIIVLGQTGCSACTAYKPVINEISKNNDIPIYYLNMLEISTSEAYEVMNSLTYFDEIESWGTPLTLIIENKEVVADQKGYNDKEVTLSFLKEHGF